MENPARERRSSRKEAVAGSAASEPRRGPKSCSSHYKGVTKHRRTGRWEAHIWGRAVNKGPGKQIYLGGFVTPEEAAEAHDLAALQLQGPTAKTNFHISKYADWLTTLQATPSEDNLPLQLRRAGMFKRCTDRAKTTPHQQRFPAREPNTPLNADAKARLSRASDSTQTADASPSNVAHFEREDSVNSQASGQGGAPSGSGRILRRPMPVRYSLPAGSDPRATSCNGVASAANGVAGGSAANGTQGGLSIPPPRQASGGQLILPSRSLPSNIKAGQPNPPQFLKARVVPQLVPLGWKSFQALAEAQAAASSQMYSSQMYPAQMHSTQMQPVQMHSSQMQPAQMQIHPTQMQPAQMQIAQAQPPPQMHLAQLQTAQMQPPQADAAQGQTHAMPMQDAMSSGQSDTAPLPPSDPQLPLELQSDQQLGQDATWMNSSAGGGIVYGHKNFLGFLTPDQVKFLEASGVRFPEHLHLPRSSPPPSSEQGTQSPAHTPSATATVQQTSAADGQTQPAEQPNQASQMEQPEKPAEDQTAPPSQSNPEWRHEASQQVTAESKTATLSAPEQLLAPEQLSSPLALEAGVTIPRQLRSDLRAAAARRLQAAAAAAGKKDTTVEDQAIEALLGLRAAK